MNTNDILRIMSFLRILTLTLKRELSVPSWPMGDIPFLVVILVLIRRITGVTWIHTRLLMNPTLRR